MSLKSKSELTVQNNNLIKANANEEITGSILNGHLKDFIDSFQIETGATGDYVIQVTETTSSSISGSDTGLIFGYQPFQYIQVSINGETFKVGNADTDRFYVTDPTGITVRDYSEVTVGDQLRYNSTTLGWTLESDDLINIQYLRQS